MVASTVAVFNLDEKGTIIMPPGVRRVVVDCGTYQRSLFFDRLEKEPDLLIIGFEPQPVTRLRHPVHPRMIFVPAAAGSVTRFVTFNAWSPTGASIKELGVAHKKEFKDEGKSADRFHVSMVKLDDIFDHLGADIEVAFVKVSGQWLVYDARLVLFLMPSLDGCTRC